MEKTTETKAVKDGPSLNYSVLCSILLAVLAIGIAVFSLTCKESTCYCDGQKKILRDWEWVSIAVYFCGARGFFLLLYVHGKQL